MRTPARGAAFIATASFLAGAALNLGGYHQPLLAAVFLLVALLLFMYFASTRKPIHRSLYRARKAYPVLSLIGVSAVGAIIFGAWWRFLASPSEATT